MDELPNILDETYERTLLNIDNEKRKYARRLFRCLAVSTRPLRVEELADILAVKFHPAAPPIFNADWRPTDPKDAVLSACSTLIAIVDVDGCQVVQFAHFSVKEFLTSDRLSTSEERLSYYHIRRVTAHTVLARACVSLLLQLDDKIDKYTISRLPLAPYAAQHWVDHARFEDVSSRIEHAMERLFDSAQPQFAIWIWLYDIDHDWVDPMSGMNPTQPQASPLYYASLCGLHRLVQHLAIAHPSDIHRRGGYHITPLHAASVKGHVEVARVLLSHGADPNSQNDERFTPLHWASRRGHLAIVDSLLEHDAHVDPLTKIGRSPLSMASNEGRLEVARFLLNHGANVSSQDHGGCTPLHRASQYGEADVVQLLLDRGSNMELRNHNSCTPLHLSAQGGHFDVVQVLLQHGAIVDAIDNDYQTPLHKSSRAGYLDVVRLLLKHGADLNAQDKDDKTPWDHAERNQRHDVSQFLSDHSTTSSQPNEDRDSLHTASKN